MKISLILLLIVGSTVSQAVNVKQGDNRRRNDVFSTNPTLVESTTDNSALKDIQFSHINIQSGGKDAFRGDISQKAILAQGLNSARSEVFRQSGIKTGQNMFRSEQMRPSLFSQLAEQREFKRLPEQQQLYGQEQSLSEQQQFYGNRQDNDRQQQLFRNHQANLDRHQFADRNRQGEFGQPQMFGSNENILGQQEQQYYSDRQDMSEQPQQRFDNNQERFRQQQVFENRQDNFGRPQHFSNDQERLRQQQPFGNKQDNLGQPQHFSSNQERVRQQQMFGNRQDQREQQQFFENREDKVEQLRLFNERQANGNQQQFIDGSQASSPKYSGDMQRKSFNQNQRINNVLAAKSNTKILSGKGLAISTEPQTRHSLSALNKNQSTGQAQGITLQSSLAVSGINNPPLLPTLSGQSGLMPSVYSVGVSKGTPFKAANMDQLVQTPYARYAFRHVL